jgi:TctA family transporter
VFFTRPISLSIIIFTVALLIVLCLPALRRKEATVGPDPVSNIDRPGSETV